MTESGEELPAMRSGELPIPLDVDAVARAQPFHPGLPTGTGLGKYRILERIRTFHNAVVYKARDLMLDRLVAIKQMSPELIDNPVACGNFKREGQLLARIPKDSRYVLNIHELIEDEIGLFIVEEYVAGHWLESLIFKRQADHRDAYRLLKTAALGLRTLHGHMIVHRDIHPGNIMVSRGGNAKIANLSSAAHEGDPSPPPVITPQYAAPELLLEKRYDSRVDIYGLGMAMYEVCVGRPAIERHFADIYASDFRVGRWIDWQTDYRRHLPDASELNPVVPPQLASILRRMTAKDLGDRYTTLDEVLEDVAILVSATQARQALAAGRYGDRRGRRSLRELGRLPALPASEPIADQPQAPPASPSPPWRGTTTHTVRTRRGALPRAYEWQQYDPYGAAAPGSPLRRRRPPDHRGRRSASPFAPPRPVEVAVIPAPPPPAREVHKRRTPAILKWTIAALIVAAVGVSATGAIWYYNYGPGSRNPLQRILEQGIVQYQGRKYGAAEDTFEKMINSDSRHRDSKVWKERAQFWLDLSRAQMALEDNQFETVQALLREAGKRGVNPAEVDDLQQKAWLKRDAQRLAEEGMEELAQGNITAVEAKLDEYSKKAAAAGLDPDRLKDSLDISRRDQKQREYLEEGRAALKQGSYLEALNACEKAESIQPTSATRELRNAIVSAQTRKQWIDRGDQAILDRDFAEAERCMNRAIQILPDRALEQKARLVRALVLFDEANQAIAAGDLLEGERKLKSSLWNTPTPDAQTRLSRMQDAFDAARVVRRADQAAEAGNHAEAIEMYEKALPDLPAEVEAQVRAKIDAARRAILIREGDEALKRDDRDAAKAAFEQAARIADGADVQERLRKLHSTSESRPAEE